MKISTGVSTLDNATLLEIIRAQSDIAKLGLDLGGVMAFVAQRAEELTGAQGAVVELAEGHEMVYRAASGSVGNMLGPRLARETSLSGLFRAVCEQRRNPALRRLGK